MIGGDGLEVVINESKFGHRKQNVGRIVDGTQIFGAIEKDSAQCFFDTILVRNKVTLLEVIKTQIKPNIII